MVRAILAEAVFALLNQGLAEEGAVVAGMMTCKTGTGTT